MERCVQIEAYRAGFVLGCWDRACSKFLSDFSAEFHEDRQTEGFSTPWEVFISHPALLTETEILLQHRTMHRAEQRTVPTLGVQHSIGLSRAPYSTENEPHFPVRERRHGYRN